MSLLLCSYSSGQTAHRRRWIMWWPSEFLRLYMAIVYELSTLQLMLQMLIDHMISRLEVWVCNSAVLFAFVIDYFFILNLWLWLSSVFYKHNNEIQKGTTQSQNIHKCPLAKWLSCRATVLETQPDLPPFCPWPKWWQKLILHAPPQARCHCANKLNDQKTCQDSYMLSCNGCFEWAHAFVFYCSKPYESFGSIITWNC